MADELPATKYYRNLGGVNLKASLYEMSPSQFLNIRNLDFDVPNALQQRPGSSFISTNSLSGPVISLAEYEQLSGSSFIIAHDSTALWYLKAGAFTLLQSGGGWSLSQPADMQVFNNKLWAINGNTALSWDGSTIYPLGLPCPKLQPTALINSGVPVGQTVWTVYGSFTQTQDNGNNVAIFLAYSYVRGDGYLGPLDFSVYAKNLVGQSLGVPANNGQDVTSLIMSGVTVPSGQGITAVAVWIAAFPYTSQAQWASIYDIPYPAPALVSESWITNITLSPAANLGQFYLFSLLPTNQATYTINFGGFSFSGAHLKTQFSGMPFCWFNTNMPKYMEITQDQKFVYAGFSNTPSSIWITDTGDPETIEILEPPLINNFNIRTNDGDVIRGLKQFGGQTIILKERSFHVLVGNSFQNYEVVQITDQYGCLSKKSVIQYGQKLLWLDEKGIVEFNGTSFDIISDPVEPIFRRMNLSAAREKACAVHVKDRNQLWWGIPIDGSAQNNITVVFDYLTKAWTFFDGFNPASLAQMRSLLPRRTAFQGDYSGHVLYFGSSLFADGSGAFTCLALTRFEAQGENETNLWRRFFLDVSPVSGLTGSISITCFANYNTTSVQFTASMVQNSFQSRTELGVEAKSIAVQFQKLSASLPLLINGYALAGRPLRNV